ncbi:MAG: DUF1501 domain-containing protein [Gemmataceae bacterium]|nr:DUF1501 domain-containing protein [Gemmataceae bacterium]
MNIDHNAGCSRRAALIAGGLGVVGLSLPQLLRAESVARTRRDKSIILVVPWGGPSQHDTLDPKPDAPQEVRSVYGHIATRTVGLRMGEHFSRLANLSDRFSILRAVSHPVSVHHGATHYALTGHRPRIANAELTRASRADYPTMGSVLARVQPSPENLPPFVQLPNTFVDQGIYSNGQNAGYLGVRYDPLVVTENPRTGEFSVGGMGAAAVEGSRLDQRRDLLAHLDKTTERFSAAPAMWDRDVCYSQAFDLLRTAVDNHAFDLARESNRLRERYGRGVGQSMLVARRLVEAGVRLVMVNDAGTIMKWDTHDPNYGGGVVNHMRETDRVLSALLEDLHVRGLLESTIVIWMGEFGRTPRRKADGGRDHWPHCYSVLLAGGGIRGGQVYGSSDSLGAYPRENRVRPEDIHATIYRLLGVPLETELHDSLGRPYRLCGGTPIEALL